MMANTISPNVESVHKMTDEAMIARRVKVGFNKQESEELLKELKATFAPKNLPYALAYNQFITSGQADKLWWEAM